MNFTLTADKAKNQAKLLAAYLGGIKRKLPHGNALEAVAQMYGAKSWNVLSAQLASAEAPSGAGAVAQSSEELYLLVENGERIPAHVNARIVTDDHRAELEFDAARWFLAATDEAILGLASIDWSGREEADVVAEDSRRWNKEVEGVFEYLETANDIRSDFDDTVGFEVYVTETDALKFLRAFRYSLFVKVALQVSYGSLEASTENGYFVEQRENESWGYCANYQRAGYSFRTQDEAWAGLGVNLEMFPSSGTENQLNSSNRVRNGSGTKVASAPEAETMLSDFAPVLGRDDKETGDVLVLKPGDAHLSREALRTITNDCDFGLQVAVPVFISDLIDNDIEFLNDQVSEAITGSCCDLPGLSFKRYSPKNEAALVDMGDVIFVLVSANWEPMDGIEGDDD